MLKFLAVLYAVWCKSAVCNVLYILLCSEHRIVVVVSFECIIHYTLYILLCSTQWRPDSRGGLLQMAWENLTTGRGSGGSSVHSRDHHLWVGVIKKCHFIYGVYDIMVSHYDHISKVFQTTGQSSEASSVNSRDNHLSSGQIGQIGPHCIALHCNGLHCIAS